MFLHLQISCRESIVRRFSVCFVQIGPIPFRPVAGREGPGVRTPPEPFRVTFPNRVNPVIFFIREGGGLGLGRLGLELGQL